MIDPIALCREVAEGLGLACIDLDWYLSGDGMLRIKQEMAKREKPICIASLQDSKLAMAWYPLNDVSRASFADTEPLAVLLAAAAALKELK